MEKFTIGEATEFLGEIFGGVHRLRGKITSCGSGFKYHYLGEMATYDMGTLTKLVLLAHERCIRTAIQNSGPGRVCITVHKRSRAQRGIMTYHPTIEESMQTFLKRGGWIKMSEQEPDPKEHKEVLIVVDYTEWGRSRYVRQASVHFEEKSRPYGGPNSLIGSGNITGLYFGLPAVIPKEVATYWQPIPCLPE